MYFWSIEGKIRNNLITKMYKVRHIFICRFFYWKFASDVTIAVYYRRQSWWFQLNNIIKVYRLSSFHTPNTHCFQSEASQAKPQQDVTLILFFPSTLNLMTINSKAINNHTFMLLCYIDNLWRYFDFSTLCEILLSFACIKLFLQSLIPFPF